MKRLAAFLKPAVLAAGSLVLFGLALPAVAGNDEDARKHFEAGELYFKTSDYEGALREFQMAYKLSKRPLILLNTANVYERMGRLQDAIDSLKRYLAEDPNAKERATIELRIQNLQKRVDDQAKASADSGAVGPAPSDTPPTPPVASDSATAAPTGSTPPPVVAAPNRTPAYITWGIGGAAVVGAVITGVIAKGKYNDADSGCHKTAQGCSDSDISPIKSMALVSTILTGVAVVGAGLGTYFFVSAKPQTVETATGYVPRMSAGVAPGGGGVSALWRF